MSDKSVDDLKVLCCMTHFYAGDEKTDGNQSGRKSFSQDPELRRTYAEKALASCRALIDLPEVGQLKVLVCGKSGFSLVPLDVEFDEPEPRFLVSDTLEYMAGRRDEFDYYILVEDDIIVPSAVLRNVIEFDQESLVNEALHPNRLEIQDGTKFNTDLRTRGEWTIHKREFKGRVLQINVNPHSAVFILSREKFHYCLNRTNLSHRGAYTAGFSGGAMASAFANFLAPILLYRPYNDLEYHCVIHQDPFEAYQASTYDRFSSFMHSLLPPTAVLAVQRIKRLVTGKAARN